MLLSMDIGPYFTRGQTSLPSNFRQKAPEIHGSLVSPRRPVLLVFVPLEAGRIDAGDVGTAILVEVHHSACRGAHAAVVQRAARPVPGCGVVAVEIDASRLSAEAGDDFVHAIAVEVGGLDGVAIIEAGVDDFALPLRAVLSIDRDLIAVPGLDGGQKPRHWPMCGGRGSSAEVSHGDIAGAGLRPGRGVALGHLGARPAGLLRISEEV